MNRLKNLIRLLALLTMLLGASPALASAHQPASAPDKLLEDFRNFQNFGSLDHQPASTSDRPGADVQTRIAPLRLAQTPSRNDTISKQELAASNSTGLEMIGHLGGVAFAVALDGNYAYLATQGELAVLDVSDPANPVRVGYKAYPFLLGSIDQVTISKGFAYLISYSIGLVIIDVSDPFHPGAMSTIKADPGSGTDISSIAIYQDYIYLAEGGNLWIYDISQPALPQPVGPFSFSTGAYKIAISGQYAYLLGGVEGLIKSRLAILDLAHPAAPQEVGHLDNLDAGALAVQGNYVYVAGSVSGLVRDYTSLQVVNISDPGHPSPAGSIDVSTGVVFHMVAKDQYLYLAAPYPTPTEGLLVYSLQDPSLPVLKGSLPTKDGAYNLAVAPDSKYAYMADHEHGLRVVDVSNPEHLFEAGAYDPLSTIHSMGIANGFAYTSSFKHGIQSIDLSNPQDPKSVGFAPVWKFGFDLHLAGGFAYTAEQGGGGIRIYNIADPAHITEVASVAGSFTRLEVGDGVLYAWSYENGQLTVIDIHNPYKPDQLGSFNFSNFISDLALTGSKAYIAALDQGCLILDVSNPANPRLDGKCSQEKVWNVEISGKRAYLLTGEYNGNNSMRVLDISDPLAPNLVGEFIAPYETYSLNVYGDLAFLYGSYLRNLILVDVSNPRTPHQVGGTGYGPFNAVGRDGDLVYLGGDGGLLVMELASSITGRVTDASHYPVQGATILSSSGITATTDANGSYSLENLVAGSYTITPTMNGYTFDPLTRRIMLPTETASQDFTLLPEPVSITAAPGITSNLAYTGYQGDITNFEIPPGAFSLPAQVIVTPTVGIGLPYWAFAGHAFELSARDSQGPILDFAAPVTLTIAYTDFDIRFVTDESQLILYGWEGNNWVDSTATCTPDSAYTRDLPANQVFLPICQAGKYALYGPTHAILLPAILVNLH